MKCNVIYIFCNDYQIQNNTKRALKPMMRVTEMLEGFKRGECNAMVCTDIASRGLDTTQVNVM